MGGTRNSSKEGFTFELAGIDSDNFAYVGKRTTGDDPGFGMAGIMDDADVVARVRARRPVSSTFSRWTGRPNRAENYGRSTDLNRFFSI